VRRLWWLVLLLPLAGCAGGPHYDFLTTKDCLQRAAVPFRGVTKELSDGGDGTLQVSYGGESGILNVGFYPSAQTAADLEDGYSAWVRNSDPRMPWAKLRMRRRGNVFLAWYDPPPRRITASLDRCLDEARDHDVG
jgi:hypothetical protein